MYRVILLLLLVSIVSSQTSEKVRDFKIGRGEYSFFAPADEQNQSNYINKI